MGIDGLILLDNTGSVRESLRAAKRESLINILKAVNHTIGVQVDIPCVSPTTHRGG